MCKVWTGSISVFVCCAVCFSVSVSDPPPSLSLFLSFSLSLSLSLFLSFALSRSISLSLSFCVFLLPASCFQLPECCFLLLSAFPRLLASRLVSLSLPPSCFSLSLCFVIILPSRLPHRASLSLPAGVRYGRVCVIYKQNKQLYILYVLAKETAEERR